MVPVRTSRSATRQSRDDRLDRPVESADVVLIAQPNATKQLKIRRADRCVACGVDLPAGTLATWHPATRTITCVRCAASVAPPGKALEPEVREGHAGASALREYQRRRDAREEHARKKLGAAGVLLSRVIEEPQSARAWETGARAEVRTAERLAKLLSGEPVRLLHDRRVPKHGHANIDHIAVGPSGVLVIDTKAYKGKIRTEKVGGLFSPRRTVLLINGRDQTRLIAGVERQLGYVRAALDDPAIEVRGALCFPDVDGLPLLSRLAVGEIVIDGPKRIAKIAAKAGNLEPPRVEEIWNRLARALPPA
jgi:hypothetical protein